MRGIVGEDRSDDGDGRGVRNKGNDALDLALVVGAVEQEIGTEHRRGHGGQNQPAEDLSACSRKPDQEQALKDAAEEYRDRRHIEGKQQTGRKGDPSEECRNHDEQGQRANAETDVEPALPSVARQKERHDKSGDDRGEVEDDSSGHAFTNHMGYSGPSAIAVKHPSMRYMAPKHGKARPGAYRTINGANTVTIMQTPQMT